MSRHERYGWRDEAFSKWHRSLGDHLKFLDIDWLEFCDGCSEPLAIVEIAQDVGQTNKPTTVTRKLAERSGLPGFCILYKTDHSGQLTAVRMKRVYPRPTEFKTRTPKQLETFLERIHARCPTGCQKAGKAHLRVVRAEDRHVFTRITDEDIQPEYYYAQFDEDVR